MRPVMLFGLPALMICLFVTTGVQADPLPGRRKRRSKWKRSSIRRRKFSRATHPR
jgi:hypothetical protein